MSTNHDLPVIAQWLRSNKISLNANKTEIIIFRSKWKQITKYLNFQLSGQKINVSNKVRYLGIEIEQHLDWNARVKNVIPTLNRAIGILSKIQHYVPKFLLKTIYYSLFNSHLIYASQVQSQNKKFLENLSTLQDKAIRIINFKQYDHSVDELYHTNGILKIKEYIDLLNCLFVKTVISNESLPVFYKYFERSYNLHNHTTRQATHNSVKICHMNTQSYGHNSVRNKSASTWNLIVSKIKTDMITESTIKVKKMIKTFFINSYQNQ